MTNDFDSRSDEACEFPNSQTRMRETLSCLHASDDTCDRVFARAAGRMRRRPGHARPLALVAVVTVACALVAGGAAYAVVNGNLFERAWGNHGRGEVTPWTHDGLSFSRSYGMVDGDSVPAELSACAEEVGYTISAHGYTLSIGSLVVDENGCGAVDFVLTNPDGIDYNPEYGTPGELVFGDDSDLRGVGLYFGEPDEVGIPDFPSHEAIYDEDASTDTEVRGTIYFASFKGASSLEKGIRWEMSFAGDVTDTGESSKSERVVTDAFIPSRGASSKPFAGEEGSIASLSPFSLVLDMDGDRDDIYEFSPDRVALQLGDGSEVVVQDMAPDPETGESQINYYTASAPEDMSTTIFTLTQLVDVDDVVGVHVEGHSHMRDGGEIPVDQVLAPTE